MRVLLVLFSLLSLTSTQDAAFIKKYNNLVSQYLGPNTPKMINLVADGLVALKSSDDLMKEVAEKAFGMIPQERLLPAWGLLTNYGKCWNATGSTNPNSTTDATAFAFNKFVTPLSKKITTKVTAMKKNKKADKAIRTEAFKIATAGLTKKLVQNFLDAVKGKLMQAEWTCGVPVLNAMMQTKNYDMTWKKSG